MFVRKQSNGELILIGQTDHSRFVGQLAAHGAMETSKGQSRMNQWSAGLSTTTMAG